MSGTSSKAPPAGGPGGTPHIRYCTAPDGVRLAVATRGQGPAIVKASNWLSHIVEEERNVASAHWVSELSRQHTLVRYDARGCGLSDREVAEVSLDAWVADLETVVDTAGLERFVLLGISQGAAIAIRYAVRHPERVRGMILFGAFARGIRHQGLSDKALASSEAMIPIAEMGWGNDTASFRQLFTSRIFRSATAEQMSAFDALHRHTVSGPVAARFMRVFLDLDVRAEAQRVACPTLVMHARDERLVLKREGELVASLIPGARWVEVQSSNHLPLADEPGWSQLRDEMRSFLRGLDVAEGGTLPMRLSERQRAVLKLVAQGLTDKEAARELSLSPRTVEMHVARALEALHCRNRSEAVRVAMQWKLID